MVGEDAGAAAGEDAGAAAGNGGAGPDMKECGRQLETISSLMNVHQTLLLIIPRHSYIISIRRCYSISKHPAPSTVVPNLNSRGCMRDAAWQTLPFPHTSRSLFGSISVLRCARDMRSTRGSDGSGGAFTIAPSEEA